MLRQRRPIVALYCIYTFHAASALVLVTTECLYKGKSIGVFLELLGNNVYVCTQGGVTYQEIEKRLNVKCVSR